MWRISHLQCALFDGLVLWTLEVLHSYKLTQCVMLSLLVCLCCLYFHALVFVLLLSINLLDKARSYLYTIYTVTVTVFPVYVCCVYCYRLISLSLKH